MARSWLLGLGLTLVALTMGCNNHDKIVAVDNPPFRVDGVYSVTGDGEVSIFWRENQENDISYYKVYRNSAPTGTFTLVGTATTPPFVDNSVTNGTTYYYAVAAVDNAGQESAQLSVENVFDTPRPSGIGVILTDANAVDATSGFDFSLVQRRASGDPLTDVYFAKSGIDNFVHAANGTQIQDAGYLPLDSVDYAPPSGWSGDGVVEAIQGHSYIVLTAGGHYAKFYVYQLNPASIEIDWAYQVDPNNPELARKAP